MRPTQNTEVLKVAQRLRERNSKPILFLGAGCSMSAGLAGEKEICRRIGKDLGIDLTSLDELAAAMKNSLDLCLWVRKELATPNDKAAFEKLAFLISQGYFNTILTANWDFLLETSLSHFLSPDEYRVYVRGEIQDQELVHVLQNDRPRVKVIKLHGDVMLSPVIRSTDLMKLSEPLENALRAMIQRHSLIVIGYSFKEPRFFNLIGNADVTVVDPVPPNESMLRQIGNAAQQISGEDGKFHNFVDNLCGELLAREFRSKIEDKAVHRDQVVASVIVKDRKFVDDKLRSIRGIIEVSDIHEERVKELTRSMLDSIRRKFGQYTNNGGVCLIFIKDPGSPGGEEIERLVLSDENFSALTQGMDLAWLQMKNRAVYKGPRSVEEDPWKARGSTKPLDKLGEYAAVVLIDSVAFSGNTLEVARNHLSEKSGRPREHFTAAVLLLSSETKQMLCKGCDENGERHPKWLDVISSQSDYSGFEVTFPWGWTKATQPIFDLQHKDDNPFLAHGISYIPKPWGDQLTFCVDERASVSLLSFERGQRTSTHYHLLRDEMFVVLDNRIRLGIWDRFLELKQHQSIRIPAGVPHSLIALDQACRILEISTGHYDLQHDIVRLADIYSRAESPDGGDDGLK